MKKCNGANVLEPDLVTSIDMLITSVALCLISVFSDHVFMAFAYCSHDIYTHVLVTEWSSHTRVSFCHLDLEHAPLLMLQWRSC